MRIPTGKASRQLDVNRDIAATFIFAYIEVETTIFIQLIRVDATPKHLLGRKFSATPK
jgi:hypothetical protein